MNHFVTNIDGGKEDKNKLSDDEKLFWEHINKQASVYLQNVIDYIFNPLPLL